ncbi:helix-turn-helix transcriptional regulator [Bradyrhizobium sp. USDA 313]|uniref:helix-turn-helix transcriptional regulator n=1 Tax=Bradyrhizobium sp. USDA 313 TaxID=3156307 RepID=UPI003515DD47
MTAPEPRLMSGTDVANYCGITLATLSKWITEGRLPPPLPGTRRWDRKALDLALDKMSGIEAPVTHAQEDEYTSWKNGYEAEKAARAEAEWERKYEARKARRPR